MENHHFNDSIATPFTNGAGEGRKGKGQTIVLGIHAYYGDVSAVLLRDGELVAAV